jgi:protein-tyrosine-phosphatase
MSRPSVLFVCVHNAGRSQMAAAWVRHLAGGPGLHRCIGSTQSIIARRRRLTNRVRRS